MESEVEAALELLLDARQAPRIDRVREMCGERPSVVIPALPVAGGFGGLGQDEVR